MTEKLLQPADPGKRIIDEEIISGFLDGMSYARDARGIILKNAGFYNGSEYVSAVDHPERVTDDSIRQVSIDPGDGNTRYFRQLDWLDLSRKGEHASRTGLKVTAWEEIDRAGNPVMKEGKKEIRIAYTGFLGDSVADFRSFNASVQGRLNPQTVEAADFTDRVIRKVGREHISNLIYASHSYGAANALASHVISSLEGVPTATTLLLEPGMATLQLGKIKEALRDEGSPLFKEMRKLLGPGVSAHEIKNAAARLDEDIQKDTVSIQAIRKDKDGGAMRGSKVGNATAGKGWVTAISSGTRNQSKTPDRVLSGKRDPSNGTLGETLLQDVSGSDPGYKTTSKAGEHDPIHRLAPMVETAQKGNYRKLVESSKTLPPADGTAQGR